MSRQMKLLIIEDKSGTAADLRDALVEAGYPPPILAPASASIPSLIKKHHVELLLTDMDLPDGVDGVSLAARALAESRVPTMFMTSHSDTAALERMLTVDPVGYLHKPFTEDEFLATVAVVISRTEKERDRSNATLEAHLQDAADSPDVICRYTTGTTLQVTYVSPLLRFITGYSREEFEGDPFLPFALVHESDSAVIDHVLKGNGTTAPALIIRWKKKNGETLWTEQHCEARATHNRVEMEPEWIVRDISARMNAEQELLSAEGRYQSVVSAMAEGVVIQGPDAAIIACNASAERVLGLTADQMRGRTSIDPRWRPIHEDGSPFPGEDHPAMITLRTGEACKNVLMGVHKPEGTLSWLSINSQPVYAAGNGQITAVVVTFVDVTAERLAQQELRESREHFRLVTETIEDVFWMSTPGVGKMLYISPAYERIWQLSREELYASPRSFLSIFHPEDLQRYLQVVEKCHTRGVAYEAEYRIQPANGGMRWIRERGFPVLNHDGTLRCMTGSCTDITERKNAVLRLNTLNESLEQRVAERILELQESETRTRVLYSSMSEAMALHRILYSRDGVPIDYRILDVNPAFEKVTGLARDRAIGALGSELYGTGNAPFLDVFTRVAHTGEAQQFEGVFDATGKTYDISSFSTSTGEFATLFQDITEKKQAEAALRASEMRERQRAEELDTIFDLVPEPMLLYDANHVPIKLNSAAMKLTGRDFSGDTDESLRKFYEESRISLPDGTRLSIEDAPYRRAARGDEVRDMELLLTRPDGEAVAIEANATRLPNGGVIAIWHNVTERRKAAAILQTTLNRFYSILSNMHAGVFLVTNDGLIEFTNKAFCEMFSLREEPEELQANNSATLLEQFRRAYREGDRAVERTLQLINENQICLGEEVPMRNGRFLVRDFVPIMINGKLYGRLWLHIDITERKTLENALRQNEEQLRLFIEHAPAALAMFDLKMRYVGVSQRWMADYRLGNMNIIGKSHYEVFPEITPRWREIHKRALRGEMLKADDDEFVRVDGTVQWLKWEVHPWHSAPGVVGGIVIFSEDVSDRKRAEIAARDKEIRLHEVNIELEQRVRERTAALTAINVQLQEEISERRIAEEDARGATAHFQNLVEQVPGVVYSLAADNSFYIQFVSPQLETLLGFPVSAWTTDRSLWFRSIHPDDLRDVIGAFEALQPNAPPVQIEYRLTTVDGRYLWVADSIRAVEDERGIVSYRGVITDITERKEADEKIREQAELLDEASDAIIVFTLEHRVSYWNRSAERIYGWKASEAIDKDLRELLFKNDPGQYMQSFDAVMKQNAHEMEVQLTTRAGKPIVIHKTDTVVCDDSGKPRAVLSISTDITEKKTMEAQFLRAQRLESLGTLAGGIAHDLNNILAPILLAGVMLRKAVMEERYHQVLTTMEQSAQRAADLVHQVLAFARGMGGERAAMQLAHLIKEADRITREVFPRSIVVERSIEDGLWTVVADPTQVHQVLMNLLVNAKDAMPDGGHLTISAANQIVDAATAKAHIDALPGPYVMLSVRDTGTGIPCELLGRIFDPFFTTKEPGKGTGLGLATVLTIVKGHGGFLHVDSQPGRGTEFKVYFPAEPTVSESATPPRRRYLQPGKGEGVLLIDDEVAILEITRATLELNGYTAYTARGGEEGIALYTQKKHCIDVVVTDLMMPGKDGATTIRTLREINPSLRVIAMSGLLQPDDSPLTVDANAFLHKPFSADALLTVMRSVLDRRTEKVN
jgi:PAS domain S-box-containing protein